MANFGQAWAAAADAAGRAQQRQLWQGMGAWERHKRLMHDLATLYRGAGGGGGGGAAGAGGVGGGAGAALAAQQLPEKSDYDILRDHHRFIRTEQDDARDSWEVGAATCPPPIVFRGGCCHLPAAPSPCKAAPPPRVPSSPPLHLQVRLARRYYSKLFKEYAVADLSRHKEGRVGLRWRTQVRWGRGGAARRRLEGWGKGGAAGSRNGMAVAALGCLRTLCRRHWQGAGGRAVPAAAHA